MKLKPILEELHNDPDKVLMLKAKRHAAHTQLKTLQLNVRKAQAVLDNAQTALWRKKKTFQLLDEINAEFEFEVAQKKLEEEKLAKQQLKRSAKTKEKTIEDVMTCLAGLTEEQQQAVLQAMQEGN